MATAFEAITTRQSWYASAAVAKYDAVEIGSDGKYQKANGTGIFAGYKGEKGSGQKDEPARFSGTSHRCEQ